MNLKSMNEAFKRRYSDMLTEAVDPSYREKLRKALVMKSMEIVANGGTIKQLEIALQEVITDFFPGKDWWEVTDCGIYLDLLAGSSPREVCDHIVDQMKPDCCDDELAESSDAESKSINEDSHPDIPDEEDIRDDVLDYLESHPYDWSMDPEEIAEDVMSNLYDLDYNDRSIPRYVSHEIYTSVYFYMEDNNLAEGMTEAVSNPDRTISKVDKNLAKEVDNDLVRDLTLILENEGEVYRRSITPVINNLRKKKAKGQFDEKLAIQAFFHVVEGALKQPWFYRYYSYSISTVSVPERYAVAKELLDRFMEEIEFEDISKQENLSISKIRK